MAVKQYNVEGYSHLELFDHDATTHVPELLEHDATANAPERDLFAEAPEVDQHATATEGVPETGLQVEHSSGDPIPVGDRLEKEVLSLEHGEDPRWLWLGRSRKTWVIACVLMAAIIATAIGVGVGVGVPNISPEATAPPSSPIALQHGILADSSLAAVSTATGNLHVFYKTSVEL